MASAEGDLDRDPFRDEAGDCLLDPEADLDRDFDLRLPSREFVGDLERELLRELGEPFLDPSIDWDLDLDRDREFLIRAGDTECAFLSSDGDLDRLWDFRLGLPEGDLDRLCDFRRGLPEGDLDRLCDFRHGLPEGDLEGDLAGTFGEPVGERVFERDRDLECTDGEGDLELDRELAFGEEHLDGGLLRLGDVDLDLDREFCRDAGLELFRDSAMEELLDREGDLAECTERGDCDSLCTTFPSGSGEGDLEGDLEGLLLPPDFELDLEDLRFFTEDGDVDRFRAGECEGDLEYDFLEFPLECAEAGDRGCVGDDLLDLGDGLAEFDLDLLLADL